MNTACVSYLRCSGDSQRFGDTWERQNEAVTKYCSSHNHELSREFRDEGVTGKMELEGRTGLSACMAYVQEKEIKVVLVESSDRLARDMIVAEVIIREFQKIGVRVIAAASGIDLTEGDDSNPTAKLIRQILAAVAEFDRCVVVLKLKCARDRIRADKGKCDGRKSFGEKPDEAPILRQMFTLKGLNMTCKDIAKKLNSEGIPTRGILKKNSEGVMERVHKPWRGSVVSKILARESGKLA